MPAELRLDDGADYWRLINVRPYDADGNYRDLGEILDDFQGKFQSEGDLGFSYITEDATENMEESEELIQFLCEFKVNR